MLSSNGVFLDHVIYVTEDLDATAALIRRLVGFGSVTGGVHTWATALRLGIVLRAEVDCFWALVSTEDGFAVRSRRGWNMTPVLPELRTLPTGLLLDGELVAWKGREPFFPLICRRVLNRDMSIPMTFVIFDVLRQSGVDLTRTPYCDRESCSPSSRWTVRHGQRATRSLTGMRSRPRGRDREELEQYLQARRAGLGQD